MTNQNTGLSPACKRHFKNFEEVRFKVVSSLEELIS